MEDARNNIPSPPGLPFLGNLFDIQGDVPIKVLENLADIYGPIYKLSVMGKERIFISNVALMEEICDEKRFWKSPGDSVLDLQKNPRGNKGLFLAASEEDLDWQQAHRILTPAFGPLNVKSMFPEMHDLAVQLILKWARMGSSYRIPVALDLTRATFDTIALCSMDYRFNSFYSESIAPFLQAMRTMLGTASDKFKIGSIIRKLLPWDRTAQASLDGKALMIKTSREMVKIRHENPTEKVDLLNFMIKGKDPKTGDAMRDGLIAANMVTMLVAGHETTSGLLSFAFILLLQHPKTLAKAQEEVDRVVGRRRITANDLKNLEYITAVMRETLRICPSLPDYARSIRKDNPNDVELLAGGKYAIRRDDKVHCLLSKIQRDPAVYGNNAEEFEPERMLGENFNKLPHGAWKPFGTGTRGCIGRTFTWQEGQLIMAMILQNFDLKMDDPEYKLSIKQTLSVQPEGFYMRASLREGITVSSLQWSLLSSDTASSTGGSTQLDQETVTDDKPMTIIYGSNTGTCQSLAQKLSVDAQKYGFYARVLEMNTAAGKLPRDGEPTIIVVTSYEGQPPDNAEHFMNWLQTLEEGGKSLSGVSYTVLGCGHSDWVNTFQKIPILVDDLIERHGGTRFAPRGLVDAAAGEISSDSDAWADTMLWPTLAPAQSQVQMSTGIDIQISNQIRTTYLRQDVRVGSVLDACKLTALPQPEKRHLSIKLPEGMYYTTGGTSAAHKGILGPYNLSRLIYLLDYLSVLPLNPSQNIRRVMLRFNINSEATITIKDKSPTFLPTGTDMSVGALLGGFVELCSLLTPKDLQTFISVTQDPLERSELEALLYKDRFAKEVEKRTSPLDLLERYRSIRIPFGTFIAMLPPLRPRHYSISSTPLTHPDICTITYSVINRAPQSGETSYLGVASNYLAGLKIGDDVLVSVRSTNKYFRLPQDVEHVPIIMFGAGSGIAPFRGFVQERGAQLAEGRKLAPALMFMGCRSATEDRLYAKEMDEWVTKGAVDLRYAYSREPEKSGGCRYVQDRLVKEKDDILGLWRKGAKILTCGGSAVTEAVAKAVQRLLREGMAEDGQVMSEAEATRWFQERRNDRYIVDTFM